jgi:hypothetical protein
VVKVFEKFSTYYFKSLKQDLEIEPQNKKENSIYAICIIEAAIVEIFFVKHNQGILQNNP